MLYSCIHMAIVGVKGLTVRINNDRNRSLRLRLTFFSGKRKSWLSSTYCCCARPTDLRYRLIALRCGGSLVGATIAFGGTNGRRWHKRICADDRHSAALPIHSVALSTCNSHIDLHNSLYSAAVLEWVLVNDWTSSIDCCATGQWRRERAIVQ